MLPPYVKVLKSASCYRVTSTVGDGYDRIVFVLEESPYVSVQATITNMTWQAPGGQSSLNFDSSVHLLGLASSVPNEMYGDVRGVKDVFVVSSSMGGWDSNYTTKTEIDLSCTVLLVLI